MHEHSQTHTHTHMHAHRHTCMYMHSLTSVCAKTHLQRRKWQGAKSEAKGYKVQGHFSVSHSCCEGSEMFFMEALASCSFPIWYSPNLYFPAHPFCSELHIGSFPSYYLLTIVDTS